MPWGDRATAPGAGLGRDEAQREHYRRLISTRRSHRGLQAGRHAGLWSEGDPAPFDRRPRWLR